ncbi:CLUMA_CG014124, isoform A [Clunio marinus]|uniref:CLUMA_CG014124, isoform A n=1 Tax=Clunio marinus TaxID=568069 RepID=A0A1J1IQW2_9DIPT|nr:CLUMA_CG014124, isoform A [Clunio marinus]
MKLLNFLFIPHSFFLYSSTKALSSLHGIEIGSCENYFLAFYTYLAMVTMNVRESAMINALE